MSLFSGYHLIGDGAEPAEPGPARQILAPAPSGEAAAPVTVIPVKSSAEGEQWKLFRAQLQATLSEQGLQLDAERAASRRTRTALYALAGHLCQQALEKQRRQLGDRKLWDWTAEDWCRFISEHAAPPADQGGHLAERDAFARLQLEHAELRIEHVRRLEEIAHLKQALEATGRTANAPAPPDAAPSADLAQTAAPEPTDTDAATGPAGPSNQSRVDDLIRLMAATGLARLSVLRERLTGSWGQDPKSGTFQRALKAALEAGLIEEQAIQADWRGAPRSSVVTLTREGRLRAVTDLGAQLMPGELEPGQARGYPLELSVLVLKAADLLREAGYRHVQAFPTEVVLADGQPYHPPLSAVEETGEYVFIRPYRK